MPSPSRHVELALYADDTTFIVTPRLFVKYQETYLSDLERWLKKWRIATSVSKDSAVLFNKARRSIPKLRPAKPVGRYRPSWGDP